MKKYIRRLTISLSIALPLMVNANPDAIDEQAIYSSMRAQMQRACPIIWEDLGASMNTQTLTGDVWAGNNVDRAEFKLLLSEIMTGTQEEFDTMAADLATVATECASHRVALLDALISKTPRDVLLAMDAVNKGLNKSIEHLDGGWSVGDIRVTGRLQAQDGWVFLFGQTIGKSSGVLRGDDYNELFELAKNWAPNTGNESWDAGHLVRLPDMRGHALVAADNMGGQSANIIKDVGADKVGGKFGVEDKALTAAELPRHKHAVNSAGNHGHGMGFAGNHDHKLRTSVHTGSGQGRSDWPYFEGRARPNYQNTIQSSVLAAGNHKHTISSAGAHAHTTVNTGSSAKVKRAQPSMVFNVEMKY